MVSYEEEAMAKRRSRNVSMLSLVEGLHVFTRKPLQLQKRSHAHYGGTTLSQIIGPVVAPDWASEWRLQPANKKKLYSNAGTILAGGKQAADPKPDFGDPCEPVAWHAMPTPFYQEIVHKFDVRVMLDATASCEHAAVACLRSKAAYIGVVWTDFHRDALLCQIQKRVWEEYQDSASPLYQPALLLR